MTVNRYFETLVNNGLIEIPPVNKRGITRGFKRGHEAFWATYARNLEGREMPIKERIWSPKTDFLTYPIFNNWNEDDD